MLPRPYSPEWLYDRVYVICELCENMGVSLKAHRTQNVVQYRPRSIMDKHPELLGSIRTFKPELITCLRAVGQVYESN